MTFSQQYAGRYFGSTNPEIYTLRSDGRFASASVSGYTQYVCLTGWCCVSSYSGAQMFQTCDGKYICFTDSDCVWKEVTSMSANYSQASAQALVNKIIKNNQIIVSNNLLCARYADKLTTAQKQTLYELQNRLTERNQSLKQSGLVGNIETSYPQGYADLAPYLEQFMNTAGVGIVISGTAVIVISCIVVASLSTAAYFAYKRYAVQSEEDVKYSKELTSILTSKLTEEEYSQLLSETKGIVTKARIKQSLSNYGSLLKWGLIAGAGVVLWAYLSKGGAS